MNERDITSLEHLVGKDLVEKILLNIRLFLASPTLPLLASRDSLRTPRKYMIRNPDVEWSASAWTFQIEPRSGSHSYVADVVETELVYFMSSAVKLIEKLSSLKLDDVRQKGMDSRDRFISLLNYGGTIVTSPSFENGKKGRRCFSSSLISHRPPPINIIFMMASTSRRYISHNPFAICSLRVVFHPIIRSAS